MDRIMKNKSDTRVLVTGGAGFIGRNLIVELLFRGYKVTSLDIKKPDIDDDRLEVIVGSFADENVLGPVLEDIDVIFHLASTTIPKSSNDDPVFDINTNLVGSYLLLEQSIKHNVKQFIYVSSGGTVYGVPTYLPVDEAHKTDPICSYGIVKLAFEKYLQMYMNMGKVNASIIRLANPYGQYQNPYSGQGAVMAFCYKALAKEEIQIWGDGEVIRDYVHISDVITALCVTFEKQVNGVFNVGSGRGYSLNQLIAVIESSLGCEINKKYLPGRSFDVPEIFFSVDKAIKKLGWEPKVSLAVGIPELLDFIRDQGSC